MSPATQPTRRTLVKGAAWSVPVVAASSAAPAMAASPCSVAVTAECLPGRGLVFSWAPISGALPAELSFQMSVTGSGSGNNGTITPIGATRLEGGNYVVPSTQGEILVVNRTSNSGQRQYTLTAVGCSGSATGSFIGGTCVDGTSRAVTPSESATQQNSRSDLTVEPQGIPASDQAPASPAPQQATVSQPSAPAGPAVTEPPAETDDAAVTEAPTP